jgi:hypothetical protein
LWDEVRGGGEDYIMRSFIFVLVEKYNSGTPIKKNEMGGACGRYGGETIWNT